MQENIEKFAEKMSEEAVEKLNYDSDGGTAVQDNNAEAEALKHAVSGGEAVNYHELMMRLKTKPILRDHKKIGRNEPCPCGAVDEKTGKRKKYKNCCLASGKYEGYHVNKKAA